jgi:hypothetical protein
MKYAASLVMAGLILAMGCSKEKTLQPLPTPGEPIDIHTIFLKDMIVKNLPSPYYHFEYDDTGFITFSSYASGSTLYTLSYSNGRLSQVQNNTAVNKDRLQYSYENGLVTGVNYINEAGLVYKKCRLTYNADRQLTKIDWDLVNAAGSITPERSVQLSYYGDGNLAVLNDQRIEIPGRQTAALYTDTYENYDSNINAGAFSLLHKPDDHLILLPGIALQKNNPRKETRSGDGLQYAITYTYTYNGSLPVKKDGDMVILNGDSAGMHTSYNISFSYY